MEPIDPDPAAPPSARPASARRGLPQRLVGPVHLLGYLAATFAWILVLGFATAIWLLASGADPGGVDVSQLGPAMGLLTIVQLVGMAAIAVVGALVLTPPEPAGAGPLEPAPVESAAPYDPPTAAPSLLRGLARTLALVPAPWPAYGIAVGLGLVVGQFPSWVGDRLHDVFPDYDSFVGELIGSALDGGPVEVVLLSLAVAVFAPLCEELVFRGYLWAALERSFGPVTALFATSFVFTGYHLDPVQMIGVLPIGLVIGFTRWQTGSVWPGMVVHAVNNTLALALAAVVADPATAPTPWWAAGIGLVATVGLGWALVRVARRPG